jgi:hypothetical protein
MNERDETEIGRRCHSRSAYLVISARRMNVRKRKSSTPGENRTLNLLIRGQAPCPLGHGGIAY